MNWHARALLRRIALGLPLVAMPGAMLLSSGCFITDGGGCTSSPTLREHAITLEQHERLLTTSGTIDPAVCRELCVMFDVGSPDGGVGDAGAPGLPFPVDSTRTTCTLDRVADEEILTCSYQQLCRGGRAPSGLLEARFTTAAEGPAGRLAHAAHLERASVDAFVELAVELGLHGAPRSLVKAARRAAADEARHARAVGSLAVRYGSFAPDVRRETTEPRALRAMAEDNAREGCVREAYAALEAAHQAATAADPAVRAAYTAIARDEAQHALLSFAISEWAAARLGSVASRSIERERVQAHNDLALDLAREPLATERVLLGVPDAARATALAALLA